jgi:hypothetical protein
MSLMLVPHFTVPEALLVGPIDIERWLNREAIERGADSLALRPQWQRCPFDWSHALELNSPHDRTVAVDSAGAARTIKTIEREELTNYEAPGCLGSEAFRNCRPECQQNNNHNRAACNHMIRPPADHQGHYSQNTKRGATTFLMKG